MKKLLLLVVAIVTLCQTNAKNTIAWDNFDLISQFKLLQLGLSKQKVKKWGLKNFDSRVGYYLRREDGSIDARLVYVESGKYKVSRPLTAVSHTKGKSSSCRKDKYRDSYGTLLRPIEIENDALENIKQEMLIEELK